MLVHRGVQDLVRLNGILQYGAELNRSQGVGFTLWSRRMCVCRCFVAVPLSGVCCPTPSWRCLVLFLNAVDTPLRCG